MSVSLTEAQKYTTNMVKRGVLDIICKDSAVMQKMRYKEIVGNALQFLRESTLPTSEFYDPGEIWAESTGDTTQVTAGIKILGGDADVDNFLQATRSDKTDLAAELVSKKAKAVKHTFLDKFWHGNSAVSSKEFDGLHKIHLGSDMTAQAIHEGSGSTGSALNATNLDAALDLIRDGNADCLFMSRLLRRRMMQYLRSKANIELSKEEYGKPMLGWGGVPIYYDDFLGDVETIGSGVYSAKTGGATSSIFLTRFGDDDVSGLQNGGLQTLKFGQLESKDAKRWRIRWYVGMTLFRQISSVIVDGIDGATPMVD